MAGRIVANIIDLERFPSPPPGSSAQPSMSASDRGAQP
jgi:hypothetical protein